MMEKSINKRLVFIIHTGVWLVLLVFIIGGSVNIYPPKFALIHGVTNLGFLMLLFYGFSGLMKTFFAQKRYQIVVLWGVVLFFAVCFCRFFINLKLMQNADFQLNPMVMRPRGGVAVLVFLTSAFIAFIAVVYQLLRTRFEAEWQNVQLIKEQQTAQIQFLKAQINPHFLFNALNNIYSLTLDKPQDASEMVLKLSHLLRYTIYDSQQELVSVDKEWTQIQKLIELYQLKSEFPLNIIFEKTDDTEGVLIEPMILMPIVENCFKHGDFEDNPLAFAHIVLKKKDKGFVFSTRNSFNQNNNQKDGVSGVGLANIKRRLALRYGNDFKLEQAVNEGVFTVLLEVNV